MQKTKKAFALTAAAMMLAAVSLSAIEPDQNTTLNKIAEASEKTSVNTHPTVLEQTDVDEISNLILGVIAAFGTILTWQVILREKKQQEIKSSFQSKILSDLIRHMYRNKVCVCATRWKLSEEGFEKFYPSEEHLLKLKLLPEDLRFDRFDNTPDYYDILHELELKFRNFDVEVDVALAHLKEQRIDTETKQRDLKVLEFKSQLLTSEIINLMHTLKLPIVEEDSESRDEKALPYRPMADNNAEKNNLWKKFHPQVSSEHMESVRKFIVSKHVRYTKLHSSELPVAPYPSEPDNERTNYFDSVLQLSAYLDNDIRGEYPKIHLIAFPA